MCTKTLYEFNFGKDAQLMDKKNFEMIMTSACDYQAESINRRTLTRDQFRESESSSHNIMRILVDGIMIICTKQLQNPMASTNENISYQISLVVSYIRTHYLIADHIMNGDLIEGATLIRKQLESIARINELDKHTVKSLLKKTPNIKNAIDKDSAKLYGVLSEIAHFGTPDVGSKLRIFEDGERIGPSIYPAFHEDSFQLYGINTYFDLIFFSTIMKKMKEWYPDYDVKKIDDALGELVKLAIENDIIGEE